MVSVLTRTTGSVRKEIVFNGTKTTGSWKGSEMVSVGTRTTGSGRGSVLAWD